MESKDLAFPVELDTATNKERGEHGDEIEPRPLVSSDKHRGKLGKPQDTSEFRSTNPKYSEVLKIQSLRIAFQSILLPRNWEGAHNNSDCVFTSQCSLSPPSKFSILRLFTSLFSLAGFALATAAESPQTNHSPWRSYENCLETV